MARPSNFNDIAEWQRRADPVVSIDLSLVDLSIDTAPVFSKVAELGQLLEACGLNVKMESSKLTADRSKTPAQLTKMLITEQADWDRWRKDYLEAIEDPSSIEDEWVRRAVDR
ncbi:MAG: hypothetical protein RR905_02775, partial [Aurantimicrobium sp.]